MADEESWKAAISKNMFGFSEKVMGNWKHINEGELFAVYVMVPIGKIIGFGKVTKKFIDDDLFWPDEKRFNRSIWKYRIKFKIFYIIKDWQDGIDVPTEIILNSSRKVIKKETFKSLVRKAENKWNIDLSYL